MIIIFLGTSDMPAVVLPYSPLKAGGTCVLGSPPTCTAVRLRDLHWKLHHKHTYVVSIRVTSLNGLTASATSPPYVYDARTPSPGVVIDVVPRGEESVFQMTVSTVYSG